MRRSIRGCFSIAVRPESDGKTGFLREVLAPNDGFASEGSGTTGGAAALQDNIFRVTNTEYHTRGLHTRYSPPPQLRQEEAQEDVGEDAANARG